MANLTLAQIEGLLAQAEASGMGPEELAGLRDMLLMRTADLDAGEKLRLAIEQLPKTQRAIIEDALGEMDGIGQRVQQRGRAALEALSDDEWDRLVDEATDGQQDA